MISSSSSTLGDRKKLIIIKKKKQLSHLHNNWSGLRRKVPPAQKEELIPVTEMYTTNVCAPQTEEGLPHYSKLMTERKWVYKKIKWASFRFCSHRNSFCKYGKVFYVPCAAQKHCFRSSVNGIVQKYAPECSVYYSLKMKELSWNPYTVQYI